MFFNRYSSVNLIRYLLFSVFVVGWVPVAFAQESEAEQSFIDGIKAFEESNYLQAVSSFQDAYRRERQPNLAYNIAVSFERIGNVESSMSWYRTYRSFNPPDGSAIEAKIESMQLQLKPSLAQKTETVVPPTNLETAAVSLGVVGVVAASILGGMALYYSNRSEETDSRRRQGVYARDAESYAIATDLTLVVSLASLAYGGSWLLRTGVTDDPTD